MSLNNEFSYMEDIAEFKYSKSKVLSVGKLRNAVEGLNKKKKEVRGILKNGDLVSGDRMTRSKAANKVKTARRLETFVNQNK